MIHLAACGEQPVDAEAVPSEAVRKADLSGEWLASETVLAVSPLTSWTFEGATNFNSRAKIRWEVQEDLLVGAMSYEVVAGLEGQSAEAPKAGYVTPGTRCFEAGSAAELPCTPDSTTGTRGHAGDPNVVCRDPRGEDIACFPYRGEVVAIYAIKRHFDQRVDAGRVVIDASRPWYEREHMEVDWSRNLAPDPFFGGAFRPFVFLDGFTVLDSLPPGDGGRNGLHSERKDDGELTAFDFVQRLQVEPEFDLVGEGAHAQKAYHCAYAEECSAAEVRVRVAYAKIDKSVDFVPRSYGAFEYAHFPLFRVQAVGYDPYLGAAVAERKQLAIQYPIWDQIFVRDDSGEIVRDEQGNALEIPFAERGTRPIRFHITGNWPTELISTLESVVREYDDVMSEAVAFQRGTDPERLGIVQLDYNGHKKLVAESGLEEECDELVAEGLARHAALSDGRAACELASYVPGIGEELHATAAGPDVEWAFDPEWEVAVLGDLNHHTLHWANDPQANGPLGYGPTVTDPETGRVVVAKPTIYGNALNAYATYTLDSVNLQNGRVRVEDYVAGRPEPTVEAQSAVALAAHDPVDFLRRAATKAGGRSRAELAQILLGDDGAAWLAAREGSGLPTGASAGGSLMEAAVGGDDALFSLLIREGKSQLTNASVGDWNGAVAKLARRADIALANNITLADFYDGSLVGLAAAYRDRPATELIPGGDAWLTIRRSILADVVAHEMGHTFGLRHNFKGSHDALNFPDAYWQLRKESLKPASEVNTFGQMVELVARTQAQLEGGMDNIAGSSVMDYNGATFGLPGHLGRYDRAALLSSFAGATEVFDFDADSVAPDVREELRLRALSSAVNGPTFVSNRHYSQVPYLLAGSLEDGLARLQQRRWVKSSELFEQLQAEDPAAPLVVPYESCTDSALGRAEACYMLDTGADELEISRDFAQLLELDYYHTAFRRGRAASRDFAGQYARLVWRFLAPLRNVYQQGASRIFNGVSDLATIRDGTWLAGASLGFNQLGRMLVSPEYGTYERRADVCELSADGAETVPIGPGRRLDSRYSDAGTQDGILLDETGDWVWRRAALLMLTADYQVDDAADLGIGYMEILPVSLDQLLSSLFLGDHESIGPRLTGDGVTFVTLVDIDADGLLGSPPDGCLLKLPEDDVERQVSVLYAAAYLRESSTLSVLQRARIFRVGTSEEPTPAEGAEIRFFTDPQTGIRYGAIESESYFGPSLAIRLVDRGIAIEEELASLAPDDPEYAALNQKLYQAVQDAEFLRSTINLYDSVALGAP